MKIHQVAEFEGPVPRPAQVVQLRDTMGPKLVTLRLLAPWHYRQHIAGVDKPDTPTSVIAEWAKLLGEPVATFTGGNWQKLDHPKGLLLVAHLRVSTDAATKVCSQSGKRALFATVVSKSDRPAVTWIPRPKDTEDNAHFRNLPLRLLHVASAWP